MEIFLTLLSGIAWMIVYEECIRIGVKDKNYCMPLFALGLNLAVYDTLELPKKSVRIP